MAVENGPQTVEKGNRRWTEPDPAIGEVGTVAWTIRARGDRRPDVSADRPPLDADRVHRIWAGVHRVDRSVNARVERAAA
jgi:hypothetical protein